MGCLCSKEAPDKEIIEEYGRGKELNKSSVQVVAPAPSKRPEFVVGVVGGGGLDSSMRPLAKTASQASLGSLMAAKDNEEKNRIVAGRATSGHHHRWATMDMRSSGGQSDMPRIVSMPQGAKADKVLAGWPSWLTSVAGDAIKGLVPRRAESFEKLDKVSSNFMVPFLCFFLL